ncbi:MAG: hypothetical protein D4R44_04090 [Actinobacteria bacterium]|nr:MAG: hypothetical protein D4R44_04090 [Actinomycetota bacterium]
MGYGDIFTGSCSVSEMFLGSADVVGGSAQGKRRKDISMSVFAQWEDWHTKVVKVQAVQWNAARGAAGVERQPQIPGWGVLRSADAKCEYLVRPGDWILDHPQAYPIILPAEWIPILLTRKV